MCHYLCCGCAALAPLVRARCMLVASGATLLIAIAGLALAAATGDICAAVGAVALATVTSAANQDLCLATCAEEESASLIVQETSGSTPVMAGL